MTLPTMPDHGPEAAGALRLAGELPALRPQDLYEALLQAQSDLGEGVLVLADARVLYANEAMHGLCGYRPEELMAGLPLEIVAPEDLARLEARRGTRAPADRGDRYEMAITHRDGRSLNLEVAVKTVSLYGQGATVLLIRDITEQKRLLERIAESERRFRQLAEATFEAILLSEDGVILDVNPATLRMFGYGREELLDRNGFFLTAPDSRDEAMRRVFAADDRPYEVIFRRKDGTCFLAQVHSGSYQLEGRVVRVTAIRDLSEQRAIESLKDEFVSVVSHELRTPLTSIRGALGLLASGKVGDLPDKAQRLLSIAANNADRLVRLVNDILDIERIESGRARLLYDEVKVSDLLANAVEVVRQMADKAQVSLEIPPVAGRIWVDPDRFNQLLTNLLSNAIKFSPVSGTIRVEAEPLGDEWRFAVADQGRGIPADQLETIFGRFQQVDVSDARQKGGTGLGLAICRSIAQQHGGRIWAESSPSQGSRFIVVLPAGRPAQREDA